MNWRKLALALAAFLVGLELLLQLGAAAAALLVAPPALPPGTGANVLCVGDSFTYGIGASSPQHSYPGLLQARLRARGVAATVQNGGRPGKDSSVVLRQLATELNAGIEVLCVLIGTNDSWSHPELVDANVARPPGAFEWRWRTGRLFSLLTGFTAGSWQATGGDGLSPEPATPLAEPEAGFALLARAGVIPAVPRAFALPPPCPEPPAAEVDRVLRLLPAGQASTALPLARTLAARHPDCAHAWLALAAAGDAHGDQDAVRSALERLRQLANGGRDAAGSYALITALGATKRAAEQYEFARQRLEIEPTDLVAWKARQDGAYVLGDREEFLRVAPEALAIAGRVSATESAVVVRNYARAVFARDARLAARLLVAALLLDGEIGETRAAVRTVERGVDRATFAAALDEAGPGRAGCAAFLRVLDEAPGAADAPWLDVLRQHLQRMVALARARGVKLVLVGYPYFQEPVERVQREVAAAAGIPFVAVRERFDRELQTRARTELFVPDGHCNDAGYAIVAELVADVVAPLLQR